MPDGTEFFEALAVISQVEKPEKMVLFPGVVPAAVAGAVQDAVYSEIGELRDLNIEIISVKGDLSGNGYSRFIGAYVVRFGSVSKIDRNTLQEEFGLVVKLLFEKVIAGDRCQGDVEEIGN